MKLTFEINNQILARTDKNKVVADSRNYLYAEFAFLSEDWNGITKTAIFRKGNKSFKIILDEDNTCLVPWEVLECGTMFVSVFGGDLITTNSLVVSIMGSGYSEGDTPSEPTPDVYTQIISMIDNLETGSVSDEQIAKAVEDYLVENPISGVDSKELESIVSDYISAHKEELKGEKGEPGERGEQGDDGFSPTAKVTKSGKATTLTITDKDGVSTVKIYDGEDGNIVSGENTVIVAEEHDDIYIIPDKYNTGVDETVTFEEISVASTCGNGIKLSAHSSGIGLKLDFTYSNRNFSSASEILFENYDFQTTIYIAGEGTDSDTPKILTFNNCKFTSFSGNVQADKNTYIFNNCTFVGTFSGVNATLNNCRLGGTVNDAMILYRNVTVDSCYIADMAHYSAGASHTDGLQIYGKTDYDATNILVKNCRFEIPPYPITEDGLDNTSYVNACLFICLERSNGNGITVQDCILNGGGKMIYCDATGGFTLKDTTIKNIRAGYSHRYGLGVTESINTDTVQAEITNVAHYDYLYCSSVWKEESGDVKVIVSNDTLVERTLRIYTTNKDYVDYTVASVPVYADIAADSMTFEDFPFDIEYTVTGNPDFVVVYDVTDSANPKQIRFVNFTDDDVYIGEEPVDVYQKLQELEKSIAELRMMLSSPSL